jgi:hypothetical protein
MHFELGSSLHVFTVHFGVFFQSIAHLVDTAIHQFDTAIHGADTAIHAADTAIHTATHL